jgi:hypothetical protein
MWTFKDNEQNKLTFEVKWKVFFSLSSMRGGCDVLGWQGVEYNLKLKCFWHKIVTIVFVYTESKENVMRTHSFLQKINNSTYLENNKSCFKIIFFLFRLSSWLESSSTSGSTRSATSSGWRKPSSTFSIASRTLTPSRESFPPEISIVRIIIFDEEWQNTTVRFRAKSKLDIVRL